MRQLLSDLPRRVKAWRQRRLLAEMMRKTPQPAPPEGLRERLVQQALAAAGQASPRLARSHMWVAWAAPGVALVVVAAWFACGGGVHRANLPSGRPVTQPTAKAVPFMYRQETAKVEKQRWPLKEGGSPDSLPRVCHVQQPSPSKNCVSVVREAALICVTVSRTRHGGVAYAKAAAWNTDDTGHRVRIEWTLVENPHAEVSRQELSGTDASGKRHSLKVAAVTSLSDAGQPKGEKL